MSFPEQDRAVQILEKEFGPAGNRLSRNWGPKSFASVWVRNSLLFGFPGTRQRREQQVA